MQAAKPFFGSNMPPGYGTAAEVSYLCQSVCGRNCLYAFLHTRLQNLATQFAYAHTSFILALYTHSNFCAAALFLQLLCVLLTAGLRVVSFPTMQCIHLVSTLSSVATVRELPTLPLCQTKTNLRCYCRVGHGRFSDNDTWYNGTS